MNADHVALHQSSATAWSKELPLTPERTPWMVINTHPSREEFALENLERQMFKTYCPRVRKWLRTRTGRKEALRPLFPGYVFVQMESHIPSWNAILSTYGVRKIVRFGQSLGLADNALIDGLKRREVEGAVTKPISPYVAGQEVRIVGGACDNLIGKILEVRENDRLVILMGLLSQTVRTQISSDQVVLAGSI